VQLEDTQPFVATEGRFAFCHNGYLERHEELRPRFRDRLRGRADSEVGFRYLEAELAGGASPEEGLVETYRVFGGRANFGFLGSDGRLLVYAANSWNSVYRFRVGAAEVASSAIHSSDDSLFDLLFTTAVNRVKIDGTVTRVGEG
jgi:predicted glutamine amidotransferase